MLFVELRYLVFFAVVLTTYHALRNNTQRKALLLAASYTFYAAWDWRFLSLILISTVVDFLAGDRIYRTRSPKGRRAWLLLSLFANLGLLGAFKYFNFFMESAYALAARFGLEQPYHHLDIILPVGISFYTFQTLSYTIDIYRGALRPTASRLDFALYVAFFPQLVAGPIVRAREFLPQLTSLRPAATIDFRGLLVLFFIGFVKKAVISDSLAPYVDAYFADPELYSAAAAWIAVLFYSVQIYCDFSGYSDMAIASAGLLGYRLCDNFDAPYLSPDIASFWRRWHMSLSSWLRDYVYIPLGGNRGGRLFVSRNLMITMLLGGLWHGASWNFVAWGFMHGLALVLRREWLRLSRTPSPAMLGTVIGTLATYYWVCMCWIFFRAPDFQAAWIALRAFVLLDGPGTAELSLPLGFALTLVALLAAVHWAASRPGALDGLRRAPAPALAALAGVLVALALQLIPTGYRPFIYFQF